MLLMTWQLGEHSDLSHESVITCSPLLRMHRFCSFLADGDLEVQPRTGADAAFCFSAQRGNKLLLFPGQKQKAKSHYL